jgi:asparaginyl-tRNA synthetase
VSSEIEGYDEILKANVGTSFQIKGTLIKSPAKGQPFELSVCKKDRGHFVKILGQCDPGKYPLAKKRHTQEYLREIAHLRPRTNLIGAMSRVRNNLAYATHLFFQSRGFQYIHTPIITASDCEGAGQMFQVTTLLPEPHAAVGKLPTVAPPKPAKKEGEEAKDTPAPQFHEKLVNYKKDLFGKPSFLTVSGQLSVENYCCALSDVYTFGPTFRAENSHTSRHLSEFWMIEPELAFATLEDNMACAEDYLKYCLAYVLQNNADELAFFDQFVEKGLVARLKQVIDTPFKRVTYTEGVQILEDLIKDGKVKFENKVFWGVDLASEHEKHLTEKVFGGPIILYNYPKDIKAFYMKVNEDDKTVQAMDILVPRIGEIIGGSAREENLEKLDRRIEDCKLEKEAYWWYRQLREYGTVPHCGFGLGFERLVMMATGIENIRDVIPFPRAPGQAEF